MTICTNNLLAGTAQPAADAPQTPPPALHLDAAPVYLADEPPPAPEQTPTEETPERSLLNATLYKSSFGQQLIDKGLDIGGWVEGSYTYAFSNPPGGFIAGRVFDFESQDPTLNQIVLYAQRAVAPSGDKFDIGFRAEMMYGSDARVIHSNGMNFYGSSSPQLDPNNQFDLTQAYVQFNVPVGTGLVATAGKFVTLLGYETINPNGNPLYSHSYLFGFAIPFTNTGVIGAYNINDKLTVTGGITRGWDQSTEDNNDSIDGIGQVKWVPTEKLTLILSGIFGPEQTDNNHDWRNVIDGIATYAATDKLSFALNGDYGWEAGASSTGGYAVWYGVAGYTGFKFSEYLAANGRLEFFNDDDGTRGIGTTVYEATVGATVTPFPKSGVAKTLRVRPEVRYDWAAADVFDGGTQDNQWTFGIDALWSF